MNVEKHLNELICDAGNLIADMALGNATAGELDNAIEYSKQLIYIKQLYHGASIDKYKEKYENKEEG